MPWGALDGCTQVALAAVRETLAGNAAERVIDRTLRRHRALSPAQRRALVESIFGVALWRRRLAWHAGAADWRSTAPELLLFALLRDLGGVASHTAASLAGLPPESVPPQRAPPADFATCFSMPDWLVELVHRELGDEAAAFADCVNVPGPICVRANALRTSPVELAELLCAQGLRARVGFHAPNCVVLDSERPTVTGLDAWRRGLFEVQDEGSQMLAALVEARPGETVLDFCAGAGGKSLALAADMQNRGVLHAFDPDGEKLLRLRDRANRAGVTCIRIHRVAPQPLSADRVLVDAPCSELGVLRRGPDQRFRANPADFAALEALQRAILEEAHQHVRPGGLLVYATCTIRREENEDVACDFERAHRDFTRVRPGQTWLSDDFIRNGFFVSMPHRHGTDAFFAAVWRRAS